MRRAREVRGAMAGGRAPRLLAAACAAAVAAAAASGVPDVDSLSAAEMARELARVTEERVRLEQELAEVQGRLGELSAADSAQNCDAAAEEAYTVPENKTWSQVISRNNPRLFLLEDFFTAEECEHVKRVMAPLLEESTITDKNFEKKKGAKRRVRNSWTGHDKGRTLERQDPLMRELLERVHQHVFIPMAYGEPVQVAKYGPGEYYELHKDSDTKVGRYATVIVYLDDTEEGGETVFPGVNRQEHAKLGLPAIQWGKQEQPPMQPFCDSPAVTKVAPRKGRAVLFFNHFPDLQEDFYAMHGSCAVKKGTKWIFQRWIRFYTDATGNVFFDTFFKKRGGR